MTFASGSGDIIPNSTVGISSPETQLLIGVGVNWESNQVSQRIYHSRGAGVTAEIRWSF